jgi:uncharacterized membrane-anchored protein YhcB (DUF1043 family)
LDATTLGAVLALVGVLSGSVVAYLGKRGENHTARWNAEMDQIQEERDGLRTQVAERDTRIAELLEQRLADQVELARLRVRVVELGGDPQ